MFRRARILANTVAGDGRGSAGALRSVMSWAGALPSLVSSAGVSAGWNAAHQGSRCGVSRGRIGRCRRVEKGDERA